MIVLVVSVRSGRVCDVGGAEWCVCGGGGRVLWL